jgi:glucokinase
MRKVEFGMRISSEPDIPHSEVVLGLDIGGTKIAAGVVTPAGELLSYVLAPTPRQVDGEVLLAFAVELAERACLESSTRPEAVGVGCGGPMIYPQGIVSPLHIPAWQDFPLLARLEDRFGLPTVLDNDAKAFALGEALFGAGRGARCMLGMVVSTGVGGGIVENGRLIHGTSGNAGHIGHIIVSARGPRCYCGATGCVTAYASGSGLATRARRALERMRNEEDEGRKTKDKGRLTDDPISHYALRIMPSALAAMPSEAVTARAIAEAATAGDPLAMRLMRDASLALGRGIASAANFLDLDRVVIGGGVAQSGDLLFGPLMRELRRRARLPYSRNVEVRQSLLGAQAGVIGAASLVLNAGTLVS